MKYRECDQIGSDVLDAMQMFGCILDIRVVEDLIECISRWYRNGANFEALLERGLDLNEPMTDLERHAYKYALGIIYARRRHESAQHLAAPFAPR